MPTKLWFLFAKLRISGLRDLDVHILVITANVTGYVECLCMVIQYVCVCIYIYTHTHTYTYI